MATESHVVNRAAAPSCRRRRDLAGPDRLTVLLLSLGAFLVVLALLAHSLRPASSHPTSGPVVVLRKIYRTTVLETIAGGGGSGGKSVTQSLSSSGSSGGPALAAPTTRTS